MVFCARVILRIPYQYWIFIWEFFFVCILSNNWDVYMWIKLSKSCVDWCFFFAHFFVCSQLTEFNLSKRLLVEGLDLLIGAHLRFSHLKLLWFQAVFSTWKLVHHHLCAGTTFHPQNRQIYAFWLLIADPPICHWYRCKSICEIENEKIIVEWNISIENQSVFRKFFNIFSFWSYIEQFAE